MRWIVYGTVRSRHAVDSLLAALRQAGQDVVVLPATAPTLHYEPRPEVDRQARAAIEAAGPADVVLNLAANTLTTEHVADLRARGVRTVVWLADDPLLFKVSYRHLAGAYDLTLHCAGADVLDFYERRLGVRGYAFPWWSDNAHFPYGYDPDAADIEVGFLGNCHRRRRADRYELLANLPWRTRFFGKLPPGADDSARIHAGFLDQDEFAAALRRFRVGFSAAQRFVGIRDKFSFHALPRFREYFFPSRLVLYAAVGIPTVTLSVPGTPQPFPGVEVATSRDELLAKIGTLIDDRDALLAASLALREQFESCLTAASRVAMLLALLDGTGTLDAGERAELWRSFPPAGGGAGQGSSAAPATAPAAAGSNE